MIITEDVRLSSLFVFPFPAVSPSMLPCSLWHFANSKVSRPLKTFQWHADEEMFFLAPPNYTDKEYVAKSVLKYELDKQQQVETSLHTHFKEFFHDLVLLSFGMSPLKSNVKIVFGLIRYQTCAHFLSHPLSSLYFFYVSSAIKRKLLVSSTIKHGLLLCLIYYQI